MRLRNKLQFIAMVVLLIGSNNAMAQCTMGSSWGSATAPTDASVVTISTCNFQAEYSTVSGIVAGQTYQADYDLGGCITVHSGTPNGPIVAWGSAPVSWTAATSGTVYIHYTTDCTFCGTAFSCGTSTIACTSCGGGGSGPCASITPLIGCGTSTGASMSGTGSWDLGTCGWSTPGAEMIFSFTATASGIHSLDITSISGGFIDFMWADASGGCSPTATWNCISDVFSAGNYGSMNWTAGNTYYILIDPEGTGAYSVTFDVNCPNPGGPVVAGDCISRTPVCTDLAFQIDPNGYGLVDELCTSCTANPASNPDGVNSGCLLSGELNSTWFEVNVAVGGTLEFSFGAPGTGNCYDWIMWPLTPTTCDDIFNDAISPETCNWNSPCDGFTGVASTPPAGGLAGNFQPTINVNTGDQFVICFSNYSSALTTVPLDFFGTADISCTTLPVGMVAFMGKDMGGYNLLEWKTGAELNNDFFDVERSFDGISFEKIGEVNGAGTTTNLTEYAFKDLNPSRSVTYYRLKQVDFDGTSKHSEIITIVQKENSEMKIASAYPNPANDVFNIQLVLPRPDAVNISISEPNGKIVTEFTETYDAGGNLIQIPVSELSSGLYLVRVYNEISNEHEVIRFTVQ